MSSGHVWGKQVPDHMFSVFILLSSHLLVYHHPIWSQGRSFVSALRLPSWLPSFTQHLLKGLLISSSLEEGIFLMSSTPHSSLSVCPIKKKKKHYGKISRILKRQKYNRSCFENILSDTDKAVSCQRRLCETLDKVLEVQRNSKREQSAKLR